MELLEVELDQDALDNAIKQINYFANIPKHIRANSTSMQLQEFDEKTCELLKSPAHVVNGTITIKSGRLNIPVFN